MLGASLDGCRYASPLSRYSICFLQINGIGTKGQCGCCPDSSLNQPLHLGRFRKSTSTGRNAPSLFGTGGILEGDLLHGIWEADVVYFLVSLFRYLHLSCHFFLIPMGCGYDTVYLVLPLPQTLLSRFITHTFRTSSYFYAVLCEWIRILHPVRLLSIPNQQVHSMVGFSLWLWNPIGGYRRCGSKHTFILFGNFCNA